MTRLFRRWQPARSNENFECQIDPIAQSWSVISRRSGAPEKAMNAVLSDWWTMMPASSGFTPPLPSRQDPAINLSARCAKMRQYTHAATCCSCAPNGARRRRLALLRTAEPDQSCADRSASMSIGSIPGVIAADIYGEGQLTGRGGWTWYTGSAGWLYRVAIEGILGIRVKDGHLYVKPALPSKWDGFAADLDLPGGKCRISVSKRSDAVGYAVTINDKAIAHPEEGYLIGR